MKVNLFLGNEETLKKFVEEHPELTKVETSIILAEGIFESGDNTSDYKGFDKALEILGDSQYEFPVIVYSPMVANYFMMDNTVGGIGDKFRKFISDPRAGFIGGPFIPEKIYQKYLEIIKRK